MNQKFLDFKDYLDSLCNTDDFKKLVISRSKHKKKIIKVETTIHRGYGFWSTFNVPIILIIECFDSLEKKARAIDVWGFHLNKNGTSIVEGNNRRSLDRIYPTLISKDAANKLVELAISFLIEKLPICDLKTLPTLPVTILEKMKEQDYFNNYSLDDRVGLYEQTQNSIFITKEVLDVFIF